MPLSSRKHSHIRILAALALAAALASCAGGPATDTEREAQAIRDLEKQWNEAVAARDSAATAGFYTEDAAVIVAFRPAVTGRAAIRSWWAELLSVPQSSLTFAPTTVTVARSGDLAYDLGTYQTAIATPQGRMTDTGYTLIVWKKVEGRWMVAANTFSSEKPLFPEAPPASQ